jgi:hypothetical protein
MLTHALGKDFAQAQQENRGVIGEFGDFGIEAEHIRYLKTLPSAPPPPR